LTVSIDSLPALAADLVALGPDVLITWGPQSAVVLKSATVTIPIVFVPVFDPVGLGLVQTTKHRAEKREDEAIEGDCKRQATLRHLPHQAQQVQKRLHAAQRC